MFKEWAVLSWARALTLIVVAAVLAGIGVVVPSIVNPIAPAQAAPMWPEYNIDMSKFQAGRIITDELFFDGNAMSVNGVQTFLNEKVDTCRAGYVCLKDKTDVTNDIPANPMCTKYVADSQTVNGKRVLIRESAARIIYKVGKACGISQKVILVTLEKEQGLVTDTWPTDRQYRYAMGADCPDSGDGCGLTAGFFKQVYRGVYMLKRYIGPPGTGPGTAYDYPFVDMKKAYTWQNIQYGVSPSCGTKRVYIANQATHALYVYTPYTPNDGALNAGWGTAKCGAYGNRNFFRYFFMWFGDPNGIPPTVTTPPSQTGSEIGLEKVGTVLTVAKGSWKGSPNPVATQKWYQCTNPVKVITKTPPTGCTVIPNATAPTYTLTVADVGKYVAPQVVARNVAGSAALMTLSTARVYQPPANAVLPTISGTTRPAQSITVSTGTWTGLPAPTYTYQWQVCDRSGVGAVCADIPNAKGTTFAARVADIGKYYRTMVTAANTSSATVATTQSTQVQSVPLVVTPPVVTGSPKVAQAITAAPGNWITVPAATLTYQFLACNAQVKVATATLPAGCSPIGTGSANATLALTAAVKGKFIAVKTMASNSLGVTSTYSASTTAVVEDLLTPKITGTETVGSTLTANTGAWTGSVVPITLTQTGPKYQGYPIYGIQEALRFAGYKTPRTGVYDGRTANDVMQFQRAHGLTDDGQVGRKTWSKMKAQKSTSTPTFTYRWMRCTATIAIKPVLSPALAPTSCSVVQNATLSTYTLTLADRGKTVLVEVTAAKVKETPKTRWSVTTGLIP
jgi:peptidoglycan hydrolase-like protein with peptidoglycan-binding domain